jgi:hypothetical protein
MTEANAEGSTRAHAAKRLWCCLIALVVVFPGIVEQIADSKINGTALFFSEFFRSTEVQAVE